MRVPPRPEKPPMSTLVIQGAPPVQLSLRVTLAGRNWRHVAKRVAEQDLYSPLNFIPIVAMFRFKIRHTNKKIDLRYV